MQNTILGELNNENISIPDQYTPLEYLNELWESGMGEYIVPSGESSFDLLKTQSMKGLNRKYVGFTDEIREKWKYELDKINSCKMIGYYLILWDLVSYARLINIEMSPGCGAIPGSLVAYSLGITDVDPLKYNLLIDRFLSPNQRYQVGCRIELEIGGSQRLTNYVIEKYGKGMLKLLEELEITFNDLDELSIMKETLKKVVDRAGEIIDISALNYNDEAIFELINMEGIEDIVPFGEIYNETFVRGIEITSMEDLIARISLDRPGLEDRCSEYMTNKNNPDNIRYRSQELKPILEPTYGCIVYHEQLMQILSTLAGFSPEQSNLARRAMSKKQAYFELQSDFIKGNIEKNIPGCIANGISEELAEKIFDDIWTSAIYGFNKSHAAAYAILAYRMAWLKRYHKEEYLSAVEYVKKVKNMGER